MNNCIDEEIKNKVMEILRDNIHFAPQVDGYVVHGAIDKIHELYKSFQPLPEPPSSQQKDVEGVEDLKEQLEMAKKAIQVEVKRCKEYEVYCKGLEQRIDDQEWLKENPPFSSPYKTKKPEELLEDVLFDVQIDKLKKDKVYPQIIGVIEKLIRPQDNDVAGDENLVTGKKLPDEAAVATLHSNKSNSDVLFLHDTINGEFEEFDTLEDLNKYVKENFCDDTDGVHPDIECLRIYKEVGFVSVTETGKVIEHDGEQMPVVKVKAMLYQGTTDERSVATKAESENQKPENKTQTSIQEQDELWVNLFNDLDKWSRSWKGSGDTITKIQELKQYYTITKKQ